MLPGIQSYKLIRTDLTLQGHAPIFFVDKAANILQHFCPFFTKMANVLEKAQYIRSERKEAAQNCHQIHSVDTLLTVEYKAN
jgi:Zn-finger protein